MSAAGIDIRTAAINVKPQIKILKENTRRPDRRAEKPCWSVGFFPFAICLANPIENAWKNELMNERKKPQTIIKRMYFPKIPIR